MNFVVSFGDRIVVVGLLIRGWGAGAYSDWATLLAATGLFSLAELGFQIQYGNLLAAAHARGDAAARQRTIGVGLFFYAALAVLLLLPLAAAAAGLDLVKIFRLNRMAGEEAAAVFLLLGATSVFHIARAGLSQIYRGRSEFHRGIFVDSAVSASTIASAVIAASAGATPVVLAAVYLAAELVFGFGGMAFDIIRRYPGTRLVPALPRKAELLAIGGALGFYALVQGLPTVWLNAPVLVTGWLALGGIGLVSFVVQRSLVNFGRNFATMLSVSAGVELAGFVHAGAMAQLARGVEIVARLNATLAGAMTAGFFLFAPAVITLWTGKPQLASLPIVGALILPAIAVAAALPISMLCMYANRPRPPAIALCLQTGLGIPLAYIGGHYWGVFGVALGMAVGETIGSGVILPLLSAPAFQIPYLPLALKCLAISAGTALWGIATGWWFRALLGGSGLAKLILFVLAWGLVGTLPPLFLALPPVARARLQNAVFTSFRYLNGTKSRQ